MFLAAPGSSVGATNGVTLGGAGITNNSTWLARWTALGASANGQVSVTVSAASAAVVKIHAPAPAILRQRAGTALTINHTGTLLSSTNALGPYTPATHTGSPYAAPQTDAQ